MALSLLLCGASACKRTAAVAYVASCEKHVSLSECTEYASDTYGARKVYFKKSCDAAQGKLEESACAAQASEIGSCELKGGERRHFFSDGTLHYTRDSAQQACKVAEGQWLAAKQ